MWVLIGTTDFNGPNVPLPYAVWDHCPTDEEIIAYIRRDWEDDETKPVRIERTWDTLAEMVDYCYYRQAELLAGVYNHTAYPPRLDYGPDMFLWHISPSL